MCVNRNHQKHQRLVTIVVSIRPEVEAREGGIRISAHWIVSRAALSAMGVFILIVGNVGFGVVCQRAGEANG